MGDIDEISIVQGVNKANNIQYMNASCWELLDMLLLDLFMILVCLQTPLVNAGDVMIGDIMIKSGCNWSKT